MAMLTEENTRVRALRDRLEAVIMKAVPNVLRNGAPEAIRVRTGISDGTNTVVEALRPGDLQDGMDVITDEIDESRPAGARPGGAGGGGRRMF